MAAVWMARRVSRIRRCRRDPRDRGVAGDWLPARPAVPTLPLAPRSVAAFPRSRDRSGRRVERPPFMIETRLSGEEPGSTPAVRSAPEDVPESSVRSLLAALWWALPATAMAAGSWTAAMALVAAGESFDLSTALEISTGDFGRPGARPGTGAALRRRRDLCAARHAPLAGRCSTNPRSPPARVRGSSGRLMCARPHLGALLVRRRRVEATAFVAAPGAG